MWFANARSGNLWTILRHIDINKLSTGWLLWDLDSHKTIHQYIRLLHYTVDIWRCYHVPISSIASVRYFSWGPSTCCSSKKSSSSLSTSSCSTWNSRTSSFPNSTLERLTRRNSSSQHSPSSMFSQSCTEQDERFRMVFDQVSSSHTSRDAMRMSSSMA